MIARKLLPAALMALLAAPACAQGSGKGDQVAQNSGNKGRPLEQGPYEDNKGRPLEQGPYDDNKGRPLEQEPGSAGGRNLDRNGGDAGDAAAAAAAGAAAGILLSGRERSILHDIFGGGQELKGFKKPKPLPPGIRKKIARGGAIPPGIAMTRLPDSAYARLPGRNRGDLVVIGRDVVLIDPTTRVILDVVEEVLR